MKKRILSSIFVLLMIITISLPAMAESTYSNIIDEVNLLTDQEKTELDRKAQEITNKYNCGVYIVIINDYTTHSYSVTECAKEYYINRGMGIGADEDGLMLLLSMDQRDFSLICQGDYGNRVFNDKNRDKVVAKFKDNFAEDDWYGGLDDYFEYSRHLLARENSIFRDEIRKPFLIGLVSALVISAVFCAVFALKMKTAVRQTNATGYIPSNGINITHRSDIYTHTTTSRRKITSDSGGGSSGGSTRGSGGFSSTSGKF